jgi:ribosomal protein S24E
MDAKNFTTNRALLPRKEVTLDVAFENSTPNRKQLRSIVAEKAKARPELVIVRHVYTKYGGREAAIVAYVYENEEAMNSLEHKKMIDKNSDRKPEAEAKAE